MADEGSAQSTTGSPLPSFYFAVSFGTAPRDADCSFREVSGLSAELEFESIVESVVEGGENRFAHKLPTSVKHSLLVLKRGVAPRNSRFVTWCREVLEGGLGQPITTQLLHVSLLNEEGQPLRTWSFANAWPVKWEVGPFDSTTNEVVMETVALTYAFSKREGSDGH